MANDRTAIEALAVSLLDLQRMMSDEPAPERERRLEEEIARFMRELPSGEVPAATAALLERFPSWDEGVASGKVDPVARSGFDERELADPTFLVRRLESLAAALSAEERERVADRLESAGFVSRRARSGEGLAEGESARVLREVGAEGASVDAERLVDSWIDLASFARDLDAEVTPVWRTWSKHAGVDWRRDVKDVLRRYVEGSNEVGREQLEERLRGLSALSASIVHAWSQVGGIVFEEIEHLDPRRLESDPPKGGGLFGMNTRERCWEKSKEAWSKVDRDAIERRLFEALVAFVERYYHRRMRHRQDS